MTRAAEPAAWEIEVIDDCSDLSSWTYTHPGQPSWTENENPAYIKTGTKSFYFQADAGTLGVQAQLTKNIAHQWMPDDRIGVVAYVPNKYSITTQGLFLYGSDQVSLGSGGAGRWQIALGGTGTVGQEHNGWQMYPISFGDTSIASGAPTIAMSYLSMRLSCDGYGVKDRQIYIDSICRYSSKPSIIFQFDDGIDEQYTEGFAYCEPLGVPLTLFVIPDHLNKANYLTTAQVLEMAAAGCTIGSHSGGTRAWEQTPEIIVSDTAALRDMLGLDIVHGAYPNGGHGDTDENYPEIMAKLLEAGLITSRTVKQAYLFSGAYAPYFMPSTLNLNNTISLAQATAAVDRCIKHRMSMICLGHQLDTAAGSGTWAIADWQALIDYVVTLRKQGLIRTMTIDQWHKEAQRGTRLRAP